MVRCAPRDERLLYAPWSILPLHLTLASSALLVPVKTVALLPPEAFYRRDRVCEELFESVKTVALRPPEALYYRDRVCEALLVPVRKRRLGVQKAVGGIVSFVNCYLMKRRDEVEE